MARLRSVLLALLPSLLLATAPPRAAAEETVARIPVQVVAGKLVVACDLSTRHRRIPANLFVEMEAPCGLRLHNRAAQGLRAEERDGSTNAITIHLPDLAIEVPRREHGPEEVYEAFTRYHADRIGETALVGTIGHEILARHHVVLDLAAGLLELSPPQPRREEPPEPDEDEIVVPITLVNGLVWLPARHADGEPAALALGTGRHDTIVERRAALARGRPAGDLASLRIGDEIDVTRYVALRPEPLAQVHPDGVAGMTGLGLLAHLRVEVDRVNRVCRLRETAPPAFPEADLAFFRARVADEAEAYEAWLEAWPDARLAREAAQALLDLRLDEGADAEAVGRALRWVHDVQPEDLRATAMLDAMETLAEVGAPEHVLRAGEIGLVSARDDRYPESAHRIHARMGEILLEGGEGREAWRHLLSAAFGMPEDGMVNLHLGRYYEQEGRLRRAFSRYLQAVIQPESAPLAIDALERVQARLPGDQRLSVDLVERLVAGRIPSFGAATRFTPDETKHTGHVALVEHFTNAHLEPAIGGALAFEGLVRHFGAEHVVFLSHHLPAPAVEGLVNDLAIRTATRRGVRSPTVMVVDGRLAAPGAGRTRDKERIYAEARRVILQALESEQTYTIDLEARLEGDRVVGRVAVSGPPQDDLAVHVVLAERAVLHPGESRVVIHRMVSRGRLTLETAGVPFRPVDGTMVLSFERAIEHVEAENAAFLERMAAAGAGMASSMGTTIDPEQAIVVAWVRDDATGWVLEAARRDLAPGPEEGE